MTWMIPALLFVLWALLHSTFADHGVKRRISDLTGGASTRWYRLAYVLMSTLGLGAVLYLQYGHPGPTIWNLGGWPSLVLWILRGAAALLFLAAGARIDVGEFLGLSALRKQDAAPRLDTGGFYRVVRHPLYTLGFVLIWCSPRMSAGSLALSAAASLYLWLGTYHEERGLRTVFGAVYEEYAAEVPRLVPRFRKRQSEGRPPTRIRS